MDKYLTIGHLYGIKNIYYNFTLRSKKKPTYVNENIVLQKMKDNLYDKIIDSRDEESFKNKHYYNSLNFTSNNIKSLDKDKKYLIYGNYDMSYFAACQMINCGFENIYFTSYDLSILK